MSEGLVLTVPSSEGTPGPQGPPGAPGQSTSVFQYRADTHATAPNDPGAGIIRWNNLDQLAATSIYFDWLTDDGFDAHQMLKLMHTPPGTRFVVQDKNLAVVYQEWRLVETIEYPDWFEVRVEFISSGGAGDMDHNKPCSVMVFIDGVTPDQFSELEARVSALERTL